MARTSTIFIAAMSLAGLLIGLAQAVWPAFGVDTSLAVMMLLVVSATIDLAAMRGLFGLFALSHGLRFGGLISGFTLYLTVTVATILLRAAPTAG